MDFVIVADLLIVLLVLALPVLSRSVEQNLEAFLLLMGAAAALSSGVLSHSLLGDALLQPIPITIVVAISGLLFKWLRNRIGRMLIRLRLILPMRFLVAIMIIVLALLSSVITVIIASLILAELMSVMQFDRDDESKIVVIACMAIGLGASLTPIGEPLSTIAIVKLNQQFWYLMLLLGPWIIPGILTLGVWSALQPLRYSSETLDMVPNEETYRSVAVRALRVYLFVMALVLLGAGLIPLIDRFMIRLSPPVLYWINTVSAILDNATLTASEVSPRMTTLQLRSVLLGLLISGGMLIPGNIPNMISAGKLRISSRTWARTGVPLGLVLLVLYFVVLSLV